MAGSDAGARAQRGPSTRAIQPKLFSADAEGTPPELAPAVEALAAAHAAATPTAAALPAEVRFGTSSWSFPGWQGLVYSSSRTQAALARDGLCEYATHPLLRTVGVDRSYYAPIPVDDLQRYADQLPAGFPCCLKAPATATSAVTPHARGVAPAPNPDFLSAERLSSELLEPVAAAFREHAGPFVIECAPLPRGFSMGAQEFAERLDAMLTALPGEFKYAVELRTPAWLTPEYARVLARQGAAHVYNYWNAMPMPGQQALAVPVEAMPFVVVRLLLRPGTWYEDRRERFKPFDRIVAPDEPMRCDVVDIVTRAVGRAIPAFVLVNNKAEGCAPLTVAALAAFVVERLSSSHAPTATP